jgi:dTDP-4-dehydrorhamnose reductase
MTPLRLWAGPECTVNRVGNRYHDQLEMSGFASRLDDLDRLASLGIRRMRFPLLWERAAPRGGDAFDWRWSDSRIARLQALGVAPIAGLLHHGSGPPDTDLLQPDFPQRLADYARAVAERYPQIDAYTPVNEPLTTARFSALYGLWYPHRCDDRAFVRALLNQMRASVLAMRAVREVNPAAQLVQTEDLGCVTSTPRLRYQARFENQRRWLGFDLLCGRVNADHPLWSYLRAHGASAAELNELVDAPLPPDIVGINCYVTSERFLDDKLERYPRERHGGNRRHRYADVETVRADPALPGGFAARLRETFARYRLPVALTEVHLGCTREEQMRWLHQAWQAAQAVRGEGCDIRAVTAWAAFGSFDWSQLLTRFNGDYEAGLWDVSSGTPRPTALARLAGQLARGQAPDHPVLAGPGWWQREQRLWYPPRGSVQALPQTGRPLLITGARGTLAQAFARLCTLRGLPFRLLARDELDIAEPASVLAALQAWDPWAVINGAGFVRVDDAEHQSAQWRENALGPGVLAQACARHGVGLVSFSSDLVFDGNKLAPYVESDLPAPLNAYGRGKLEAERQVLAHAPKALMVRSSAFFGPWDAHNFVTLALRALAGGKRWPAAQDQQVSPTYVPDLVRASLDLLLDGASGVWHLANRGAVSWAELAHMAAEAAGMDTRLVDPCIGRSLGQRAARPRYSVLDSERGSVMPSLADALGRYMVERV